MFLLHSFYQKCIDIAKSVDYYSLPISTDKLIHDTEYTPSHQESDLKHMLEDDGGYAYRHLFRELSEEKKEYVYICNTFEIGEHPGVGDINYYLGFISPGAPFLFMEPPVPFTSLPTYLTIFDQNYQIEVHSDKAEIEILRVNTKLRDIMIGERFMKRERIIDFLQNSDRPRLDSIQDALYHSVITRRGSRDE